MCEENDECADSSDGKVNVETCIHYQYSRSRVSFLIYVEDQKLTPSPRCVLSYYPAKYWASHKSEQDECHDNPKIHYVIVRSNMRTWRIYVLHGRFSGGDTTAMIVKPPFIRPEPPIPAIARPIMSIIELVATPQSSEPSSNIDKNIRNVIYRKCKYAGCSFQEVM